MASVLVYLVFPELVCWCAQSASFDSVGQWDPCHKHSYISVTEGAGCPVIHCKHIISVWSTSYMGLEISIFEAINSQCALTSSVVIAQSVTSLATGQSTRVLTPKRGGNFSFCHLSRPPLQLTHIPIQCIPEEDSFSGVDDGHLFPSSAKIMNVKIFYLHSSICFHGVMVSK
jgi:hypothetical protein